MSASTTSRVCDMPIGNNKSSKRHTSDNLFRLLLAVVAILISLIGLWAWHLMPIYPDEVALRIASARYIPDHGIIYGLYPLCTSNFKHVPATFLIPAWSLSYIEQHFSISQQRILPFAVNMIAIYLAARHSAQRVNPVAALSICSALIGVSGSSLVLERFESFQTMNLVCCLAAYMYLESGARRVTIRWLLTVLLIASVLFSMYVHVQGLLFLPLTLYFAYRLASGSSESWPMGGLAIALLIFGTSTQLYFQHLTCLEFNSIQKFWANMTFQGANSSGLNWVDLLGMKITKYTKAFQYLPQYAINYLPPVEKLSEIWPIYLNRDIATVAVSTMGLAIMIALHSTLKPVIQIIRCRSLSEISSTVRNHHAKFMPTLLFVWPVIFLFFYDTVQNFYRSIFINFILTIFVAVCLSKAARWSYAAVNLYSITCAVLVVGSIFANFSIFYPKLAAGYEGPSVSLMRDPRIVERNVEALVQKAGLNLNKGGIVIDDMTYESLKYYPKLYPVTYLGLSSIITGLRLDDAIARVKPNYAIARCLRLNGITTGEHYRSGDLCAINFEIGLQKD
ncbi:hypothetical protein [Trinickia acidisoli]|uniref:hypothetical protein n=1 Tax=Trinickia acidisoli TaxID=2767482 RepID=UPI001A8D67E1|nr:hypothetical protein [Trinickia acidisoli]